jgi:hypothetical protein
MPTESPDIPRDPQKVLRRFEWWRSAPPAYGGSSTGPVGWGPTPGSRRAREEDSSSRWGRTSTGTWILSVPV